MVKPLFFKRVLTNGMTVVFEQRPGSGVVSVAIAVRNGGINELDKEKGISHFIEHMLYKGTKKRTAKDISQDIEKNGGILNGFTDDEVTGYWSKISSDKLDIALDVLGDMLTNSVFDKKELDKERQVILEERKMRIDRPDVYVSDKIECMLYTGGLAMDRIGTEKTLNSIDRATIVSKFNKIYGSENMFLCAVGDAEFDHLCDFCEKTFKRSGFKVPELKLGLRNSEVIEKRNSIVQANLVLAFHAPKANDKLAYASQVLISLMAGGMSSRLFQEIREKRNLAYTVRGGYSGGRRFGYNTIFVGTTPDKVVKVKEIIISEFKKVGSLKEREINEVKTQLIGNSRISREDSYGQMIDLLSNEIWSDARSSYEYEQRISEVKLEDVKKLARLGRYSFIALVPDNADRGKQL